jgi:hypothetical protein
MTTFQEFAKLYCDTQEQTPEGLREVLVEQRKRYQPDGWVLLQFVDFSSSRLGQHVILPYGPNNTYKAVPTGIVHPYGLASDSAEVVSVLAVDALPSKPGGALLDQHTKEWRFY